MLQGKRIIGTISYMGGVGYLPELFCWSWGQMIQWNTEYLCQPGEIIHYDRATVSFHSYARNTVVEKMRGDWLLMLDTDHSFEPDICGRMLNLMEKAEIDVLTGLYQYKGQPHSPVLYREHGEGYFAIGGWDKDVRAFQVDSAGAGCLFVRKVVYDRIRAELQESPFDITFPFSEDHSFFRRLKRLGIKSYCAPDIQYHHLAMKEITMDDYHEDEVVMSERYEVEGLQDG